MGRARALSAIFALALFGGTACTSARQGATLAPGEEAFWSNLRSLCGRAFEGTIVQAQGSPGDTAMAGQRLVMHVRECGEREIRVPFHVGDDRSRTWVFSRTDTGLRLKHDHRHADGSEDEITWYGGDSRDGGSPLRQEFPADAHTRGLNPIFGTNVWTIELRPGESYVYDLRREGTDRRFRVEFDLRREVPAPPPSWGRK